MRLPATDVEHADDFCQSSNHQQSPRHGFAMQKSPIAVASSSAWPYVWPKIQDAPQVRFVLVAGYHVNFDLRGARHQRFQALAVSPGSSSATFFPAN